MSCLFTHAPVSGLRLITNLGTNGQRPFHHLLNINPKRRLVCNILAIIKCNYTGETVDNTTLSISYMYGLLPEQLYPIADGCAYD